MDVVVPAEFEHLYVHDEDHPVVKIPSQVLRKTATEITKLSNRHKLLAENMVRIMNKANGVGIAAPQVGISERIIVIAPERRPIVLVNPVIVKHEGSQVGEEGCLSIPGLYGDVERFDTVEVEAYDIKGRPLNYEMSGYAARIVQHEIDHLDGILFIDKVDEKTVHWQDPNRERDE